MQLSFRFYSFTLVFRNSFIYFYSIGIFYLCDARRPFTIRNKISDSLRSEYTRSNRATIGIRDGTRGALSNLLETVDDPPLKP